MTRRLGAGLALAVAAPLLAGCLPAPSDPGPPSGSPKATATRATPKPSDLLDRAVRTSKAARSVRVHGKGTDHGDTVGLDVRIAGHRASGHIRLNGQRIDVIRIRSVVYVSGNARFWRASTRQHDVSGFTGRYVKTSTHDKAVADLLSLMNMSDLLADVARPSGHLTARGRPSFHGVPAVPLDDGGGGTLYVAATGKPYVLGLRGEGDRLDFTGYGEPTAIEPPPASRVLPT